LAAAREEFGVSRTKLMMRGLELAIKEEEAKRSGRTSDAKRSPVSDESLSDALLRVAEMRWQATSEEERKQVGASWPKRAGERSVPRKQENPKLSIDQPLPNSGLG
jgi:hypothetical protein